MLSDQNSMPPEQSLDWLDQTKKASPGMGKPSMAERAASCHAQAVAAAVSATAASNFIACLLAS